LRRPSITPQQSNTPQQSKLAPSQRELAIKFNRRFSQQVTFHRLDFPRDFSIPSKSQKMISQGIGQAHFEA
jgi:hypothetical protein